MTHITRDITEITRCGAEYRRSKFEAIGLKPCHGSYLQEICANPGISQEQLARTICINKSNVARQAAALEEDGFVERRPCGEDKRVMRLYPTEKALELLPRVDAIMKQWQDWLIQDLDAEQQLQLENMLQRLKARASAYMED